LMDPPAGRDLPQACSVRWLRRLKILGSDETFRETPAAGWTGRFSVGGRMGSPDYPVSRGAWARAGAAASGAGQIRLGWTKLGLDGGDQRSSRVCVTLPDGVVLVTTHGLGKDDHAVRLPAYSTNRRKIITVEDPVEYQLSGINQVPCEPNAGNDMLRSVAGDVRQAPNVIMVGEIRGPGDGGDRNQRGLTGHSCSAPCTPMTRRGL